jgi:hypothetical protein
MGGDVSPLGLATTSLGARNKLVRVLGYRLASLTIGAPTRRFAYGWAYLSASGGGTTRVGWLARCMTAVATPPRSLERTPVRP